MKSRALNLYTVPEYSLPQYGDWRTNLRVLTVDDTDPLLIPVAEQINLGNIQGTAHTGARFADNEITLLVQGGVGTVVTLYAIEPTDDTGGTNVAFWFGTVTTTVANQMVRFSNLPSLLFAVKVTNVAGGVKLHGGGSR